MTDFKKGMLVQHATLGLGKVVALEPKAIHVYFAQSAQGLATKLRLDVAEPLLTPSSTPGGWLCDLPPFAYDDKAARYRVADGGISDADALARFAVVFPAGCEDEAYVTGEGPPATHRAARWRRAHEAYVAAFGAGAEASLSTSDVPALVEHACAVERHVRPLLSVSERPVLRDALRDHERARRYFDAVSHVIAAAPDEARFAALADAASSLAPEAPETAWYLATWLPFVARPDAHMIVRSHVTSFAAQRLRLAFTCTSAPSWTSYAALLGLTVELREKLRGLGARDHVDVEVFMHVVTQKQRPRAKASRPAAPRAT